MSGNFTEILNRVKKILNTDKDQDVANAIDVSINAFSNRKRNSSIPYSEFVQLAQKKNVSLNWLFHGVGPIYNDINIETNGNQTDNSNDQTISEDKYTDYVIIEEEHIDLIKNFKDKPTAKDVNEKLVDLERMSERTYRKVVSHITEVWETVTDVFDEIKGKKTGQKNGTHDT